jgi:hypothetical protein
MHETPPTPQHALTLPSRHPTDLELPEHGILGVFVNAGLVGDVLGPEHKVAGSTGTLDKARQWTSHVKCIMLEGIFAPSA